MVVHDFRIVHKVGRLWVRCRRLGRRGSGLVENGESGLQAHRGCDLGILQNLADSDERASGELFNLFAEEQGAIIERVDKCGPKFGGGATPIADGVAVDFGFVGGLRDGRATGQRREDLILNRGDR
jgi:hypothetical protein